MEYLGFESGESEEKRIEKYRKWGGDILFNVVRMQNVEEVELGLRLLMRYDLLEYELSRVTEDGETLCHLCLDNPYSPPCKQLKIFTNLVMMPILPTETI